MFIRLFAIGLIITLSALIPAYFLLAYPAEVAGTVALTTLAVTVFCTSVVSAWLGWRLVGGSDATTVSSTEEIRELGTVKWFNANKGFGFITRDSGDDVFVHFRSIRGKGHRVLRDGQRVEFLISESSKGLQAEDVAVAG